MQKILGYYRARVEAHERDRHVFLEKMDALRIKQEHAHKIQWELKKRTEETEELKRAINHCQEHLGGERGTIEEMKFGGDALRVKQNANKQKILELLEQTNSVE